MAPECPQAFVSRRLTSNLGSQALLDGIDEHGEISEAAKDEVRAQLRRSFRPEFLNRLDEIVFYKPLTKPSGSPKP